MIRLGTRSSRLALAQARQVADSLEGAGHAVETVPTDTLGDRLDRTPVHELGVAGAFTTRLEAGLHADEIDLAVHSLKDLPVDQPDGLALAAVLARGRPADVLLTRPDAHDPGRELGLSPRARVATSGPRRQSQLLAAREDLTIVNVRGNVDTRLGKLHEGFFDALVTAHVVLDRIDLPTEDLHVQPLPEGRFPPAPGQAAIAVQAREASEAARAAATLDDPRTREAVATERRLLAELGGGCGLPIGAWVRPAEDGWRMDASFAGHGWQPACSAQLARVDEHAATSEALVDAARDELRDIEPEPRRPSLAAVPDPEGEPVLVVASEPTAREWAALLREGGQAAEPVPTRRFIPSPPPSKERARRIGDADWIAVTSRQSAAPLAEALEASELGAYIAAVGPATARALQREGLPCHLVAHEATGEGLAAAIGRLDEGDRVVLAQGDVAHGSAARALAAAGFTVDRWTAYETIERGLDPEALPEDPAPAALVMSPRNAQTLAETDPRTVAHAFLALGPSTADALRELGLAPTVADAPTPDAIRDVIP